MPIWSVHACMLPTALTISFSNIIEANTKQQGYLYCNYMAKYWKGEILANVHMLTKSLVVIN